MDSRVAVVVALVCVFVCLCLCVRGKEDLDTTGGLQHAAACSADWFAPREEGLRFLPSLHGAPVPEPAGLVLGPTPKRHQGCCAGLLGAVRFWPVCPKPMRQTRAGAAGGKDSASSSICLCVRACVCVCHSRLRKEEEDLCVAVAAKGFPTRRTRFTRT